MLTHFEVKTATFWDVISMPHLHRLCTLLGVTSHRAAVFTVTIVTTEISHFESSPSFIFLYFLPLSMASLKSLQYSSILHGVSSLPGTGYVTRLGLQFVSTIPTLGMHILEHSVTATCCVRTVLSVFRNIHRSGNRVTAPYCICALVKRPPRQYLV